jgi:hypothetical protein
VLPPVMWDAGTTQPLDVGGGGNSGLLGAFNADGDAFVTLVEGARGEPLGWQTFRRTGGSWLPADPIGQNTWMRESPVALSADGTVAWSTLDRNNGELVILSHDSKAGEWKEWLPKSSLPVKLDFYHFDVIVPEG